LIASAPALLGGQSIASINNRDGVKFILRDNSWLLIRPSGTEPLLRIYAEGRTDEAVQTLLLEGAQLAERQIENKANLN